MAAANRFTVALCAGVLALLPGCATDAEHYGDRAGGLIEVPPQFSAVPEGAEPAAAVCSDLGLTSLEPLVRQALAENFELRQRWARLREADAVARAADAALWPTLEAQAGASRSEVVGEADDSGGPTRPPGSTRTSLSLTEGTRYSASLAAAYEVDLWGRLSAQSRAALLEREASAADLRTLGLSLSANVASAWTRLLAQRRQLGLLEEQQQVLRDFLSLVETRFAQGQAGALDLTQQQQELEAIQARVAQARGELARTRHRLAVLLGRPVPTFEPPPGDGLPEQLPPLPDPGIPAALLQRRPDLQAARLRLAAADARTAARVAEQLPALRLSADLTAQAATPGGLLDALLLQVAGVVSQSLFDAGRREAQVQQAEAQAQQALYGYAQALLTALQETQDALVLERRQAEAVESLRRQAELARKRLELARRRYLAGAVDYLQVLTALQSLQGIERELIDARLARIDQRINLCRAAAGPVAVEELPQVKPGEGGGV